MSYCKSHFFPSITNYKSWFICVHGIISTSFFLFSRTFFWHRELYEYTWISLILFLTQRWKITIFKAPKCFKFSPLKTVAWCIIRWWRSNKGLNLQYAFVYRNFKANNLVVYNPFVATLSLHELNLTKMPIFHGLPIRRCRNFLRLDLVTERQFIFQMW